MESDTKRLPWFVDLVLVFVILFFCAFFAIIIWSFLWIMDIGQPEEKRLANDFVRALFDPGESIPRQKSSYDQ